MNRIRTSQVPLLAGILFLLGTLPAWGGVKVQCPGDTDGDSVIDTPDPAHPNAVCMHLGAGDGYVRMADGKVQYIFSFVDLTGVPESEVMMAGMRAATFPAPIIRLDEGDHFYLNLTNVGMMDRPDLFDPHTVHWHGFPQAAAIFDGVPEASISINMGSTLTYYYQVIEPGTYMYHCHVEATEHMQMGMLGNLYVRPAQNRLPDGTMLGSHVHRNPDNPDGTTPRHLDDPLDGDKYVYNDGDGSTRYDREIAIQIGSFDPDFHDASQTTQPLPFALMEDRYPMLNGRGYPETINPAVLGQVAENGFKDSQHESSLIEATRGERILLRLSNLNVTRFYTLATLGIPMTVIGQDARLLRGSDGQNLYYQTNSITTGGGQALDILLDTTDIAPGTYFLYTTNLNYLNNDQEELGGMMTEIVVKENSI